MRRRRLLGWLVAFGASLGCASAPPPPDRVAVPSPPPVLACFKGDFVDCDHLCERGDAAACDELGQAWARGAARPVDLRRARALFEDRCAPGRPWACGGLLETKLRGKEARDPSLAVAMLDFCKSGADAACALLDRMGGDPAALRERALARCARGFLPSCVDVAQDELARGAAEGEPRLKSACDQGSPSACRALAAHASKSSASSRERAAKILQRACESDATSCCELSALYASAHADARAGAALDRCLRLRERDCDGGWGDACAEAARMVTQGLGSPVDLVHAEGLLREGCDAGDGATCASLGAYVLENEPRDEPGARDAFLRGCDAGEPTACRRASAMLDEGAGGPRDEATSRRLAEQACEAGDALGCFDAARRSPPVTLERARAFHERACQLGAASGCAATGRLRLVGRGGATDLEGAMRAFTRGCVELDDGAACLGLGLARRMSHDDQGAREALERAVARGNAQAALALATLEPKRADAAKLLRQACEAPALDPSRGEPDVRTIACAAAKKKDGFSGCVAGDGAACVVDARARGRKDPMDLPLVAASEAACARGQTQGDRGRAEVAADCARFAGLLELGAGVKRDRERAESLRRHACDGGHIQSCSILGLALDRGKAGSEGEALLKRACSEGDASACRPTHDSVLQIK